ncbi:dTDP-4-dehydrorhamnose 3,5-epimerase [Brevundimonas viscosa]|uniref:dTDP-4-dehydrorhamnose 3,5-epimerase n=1 Tax=Brevundimonas viscosa TaxID=871741 RepID=A0A1I6TNV1_9CAUL|nr:dTDP-4-dehydrorhamnose 3,5-epimerase [Brevundimonas viscosa]SFS90808.1 dTDP-4-dehydrorhamnose 3,5-epimerase [Brevundimonas viscosa]
MSNFRITRSWIPELRIIETRRFADDRGHFSETFSQSALADDGFDAPFVQDNQSLSRATGTLRGLHFQTAPFAQDKLVRVIAGSVWDVAVDLRRSSPTFRQWYGLELSAENGLQLLVPVGFAHGFLTLESDTIVAYKVTAPYSGANDAGVAWDDPDLAVGWPLPVAEPVLSDKDRNLPRLAHAALFD